MAKEVGETPQQGGAARGDEMTEEEVDRNLMGTFPASDPPSWTLGTDHREQPPDASETERESS